jgi:predicted GH43/DUF377 family glycosyl hydrolase
LNHFFHWNHTDPFSQVLQRSDQPILSPELDWEKVRDFLAFPLATLRILAAALTLD